MHIQLITLIFLLVTQHALSQAVIFESGRPFAPPVSAIDAELRPFYHGVASGDPLADRFVIWTRVTPGEGEEGNIEVSWRVATDPELRDTVAHGVFTTDADRDYTVKVDVDGLAAGRTYFYGFTALGANSLTGRGKTTPVSDAVDQLRFGVVSCSNFQAGYFHAYGGLADRNDLDAIVHLGDYIYEYADRVYGSPQVWEARPVAPDKELTTLFDYRTRYSTYRLDEDLRRAHQQHPFISVWDDHESANDAYEDGASGHQEGEGDWADRKAASRRAYFEWMPVRENAARRIYRSIPYGNLADLIMLDTRLNGRDEQLDDVTDLPALDSSRTILGDDQRAWLLDNLSTSGARWKIIGNQVLFSQLNVGWAGTLIGVDYDFVESGFLDIWDGYPTERRRVADHLRAEGIDNVVIVTGDFHSSFAFEVAEPATEIEFRETEGYGVLPYYTPGTGYDPATGEGAVAVEFATPSITAANFDENAAGAISELLQNQFNQELTPAPGLNLGNPNPHMKYRELTHHGYFVLDVTPDTVSADFFYVDILDRDDPGQYFAAGFASAAGTTRLVERPTPAPGKAAQDTPAPADPPQLGTSTRSAGTDVALLSLYPNPATTEIALQYSVSEATTLHIELYDARGKLVRPLRRLDHAAGLYTLRENISYLPPGHYLISFSDGKRKIARRFVVRR